MQSFFKFFLSAHKIFPLSLYKACGQLWRLINQSRAIINQSVDKDKPTSKLYEYSSHSLTSKNAAVAFYRGVPLPHIQRAEKVNSSMKKWRVTGCNSLINKLKKSRTLNSCLLRKVSLNCAGQSKTMRTLLCFRGFKTG